MGNSIREDKDNLYLGDSLIPETQGYRNTPSPQHYKIHNKTDNVIRPKTPSWSFGGNLDRMSTGYLYNSVHSISPDPQHYRSENINTKKRTATYKIGTATRDEVKYVIQPGGCYSSKPNPCKGSYKVDNSIGKQVLSNRSTSPFPRVGRYLFLINKKVN